MSQQVKKKEPTRKTNHCDISLEDIVAHLPGHVYWKDKNGVILGCNIQQAKDAGFDSPEEIIGKTDHEMPWRGRADEICRNDQRVIETGEAQTVEEFEYLSRKVPLRNRTGEVVGILGISISIEEYRDAIEKDRQLLSEIIAAMPGHVYWKNRDCILQGCNDQQAKDAGLSSRHEIIGKTAYDLLLQDQPEEEKHKQADITNRIDQDIMQADIPSTVEESVVLPDTSIATFLSEKVPLHDKQGNVVGLVGISFDITDRKKNERELQEAKEKAEVANKAKQQFLYNMRHDIRTPFTGILGLADFLRRAETDAKKHHYLEAIYTSAEQLLDYLNEILELTQIEDGEVPVVSQCISLKNTAKHCVDMYLPSVAEGNIKLSFSYDQQLPEKLFTDEFRIKRILINLIGNAVKFTPAGSISVKVYLAGEKSNTDEILVALSVEDTGIGIPKDKQVIIFEKFERLTPSYQGKYKGSGIGLFAVRTLLEELNADIQLISQIGKGSIFTCMIPMKKPKQTGFQPPQQSPAFQPVPLRSVETRLLNDEQTVTHNAPRILLVEDVEMIQLVTVSLLEGLNGEIDVADTGEKALALFQAKNYDLILMDIGLPDMDGYAVTRKIRAILQGKHIPIIALTAHAADDVKERCDAAGMNIALQKPLTRDRAIELLNTYVYQKPYLQDLDEPPAISVEAKRIDPAVIDMSDSVSKQGSEEGARKYFGLLNDYLSDCLPTLEMLVETNDLVALDKELHKLKGAVSLVTLPNLQQAVSKLNERTKGKSDHAIQALCEAVVNHAKVFSDVVRNL